MADNYLEKRMEELRSGRLAVKGGIPGIKPGSRRVVVAGGCHGVARDKTLDFRNIGCRVAVFDADEKEGRKMAYANGIRFHHIDLNDRNAIEKETVALLNVWRGIDIIVGDYEKCELIRDCICKWHDSLPIADKPNPEMIVLNID